VEYLMKMEIRYRPYDILKDSRMKEWVKQYSQWPTFPQVFVNGKFMGGSEMIIDMIESEEFLSIIP
jgi:monothiol glutaredoxin